MTSINQEKINTHQGEILKSFKQQFKKSLLRSKKIEFECVLSDTLFEFNLNPDHLLQGLNWDFLRNWFDHIYHHHFLKDLIIGYPDFNEIIIHRYDFIQIIMGGQNIDQKTSLQSQEDLEEALMTFTFKAGIKWNETTPFQSFSMTIFDKKVRLTFCNHTLGPKQQSKLFIRQHLDMQLTLANFTANHLLPSTLKSFIHSKKNILISGSTGSGKTTLLKTLIQAIPLNEHIIILEDTHELDLSCSQFTYLLSDQEHQEKTLTKYLTYAMRMSPDRLILGEMRGEEVIPFLLAMNTGHNGLMATIHANSSIDALARLQLLFNIYGKNIQMPHHALQAMICKNIQYIIHIEKKEIIEIYQIYGASGDTPMGDYIYKKE